MQRPFAPRASVLHCSEDGEADASVPKQAQTLGAATVLGVSSPNRQELDTHRDQMEFGPRAAW